MVHARRGFRDYIKKNGITRFTIPENQLRRSGKVF
jgi:hypothetical protein